MGNASIDIRSSTGKEFSQKITLGGDDYFIVSEDLGPTRHVLQTRVYRKGRIIASFEYDYSNELNAPDVEDRLTETIRMHHEEAIASLKREKITRDERFEDYMSVVERVMLNRKSKDALALLTKALDQYPNNPFVYSFQGYLEAVVDRNYSEGVRTCREAFDILKEQVPFGEEFFHPILYLNLGRAYLAAGKKKQAHTAFLKGLQVEPDNREILKELRKLGIRRRPAIPFLGRSNTLNKCVGKVLHTVSKGR
ncbi:MAG: hypothetical protein AB1442_08250 [Nitrospirota bacterium]